MAMDHGSTYGFWHALNYWEPLKTKTAALKITEVWEATRSLGQAG